MTAVIGRLDPFRLLTIAAAQTHATYDLGVRNKCSIQWSGDIVDNGKLPANLWASNIGADDMTRALFGPYFEQVVWRSAFTKLLDELDKLPGKGDQWTIDLRRLTPEGFTTSFRDRAMSVYTSCSKGVHQEFVIAPKVSFDRVTVQGYFEQVLTILACVSLAANCHDSVAFPMPTTEAHRHFVKLQG